jgi:N-acetylmuramoyl-L-alanine amidase
MRLRTDLFQTVARTDTRVIAVRDTLTPPKQSTDAYEIDTAHCRQGRLGIGYHFLILIDGTIQLCRRIATCGSHSKHLDDISVAIGVVGGITEDGDRASTRNPEQEQSLADLTRVVQEIYPDAETDDRPLGE